MSQYNRLHYTGLAILVAGLIVATIVYATSPASAESDASSVQIINGVAYPVDSARQMQQLERIGGKASVQIYKFQQVFESLWHGRKLAYTLIVVTALLALLCWHIADLVDETP
jgi:hypothetical protein